jgi:hypothetical protein
MTDITVKIMVEVLSILGILTKETGKGRTSMFLRACLCASLDSFSEKYLRKLVGRKEVEDALQRLDRLTQEEARMAAIEVLKVTRRINDKVKDVDQRVECVDDRVRGISVKVEEVDGKVQSIDSKVQCVGHNVGSVVEGRLYLSWST